MAVTLAWGFGTAAAYGMTLRLKFFSWRKHRDARSMRDAIVWMALFLASLASVLAFVVSVLTIDGPAMRRILYGVAFAMFSVAGLVGLNETPSEEPETSRRDLRLFVIGGLAAAGVIGFGLLLGTVKP